MTALASALASTAGCGARRPAVAEPAPARAVAPTPAELETALQDRATALATFRGQAKLAYEGPDGDLKSSQMIVVEAPDRIRLDFMSPFGPTYTVASDGTELRAYDRGEKVLYKGAASVRNVQQYVRVAVSIEVLASLIRGLPPLVAESGPATVEAIDGGWRWRAAVNGGGTLSIDFDASATRPVAASVRGSELVGDLAVRFDEYADVDGVVVPHSVSAALPSGGHVELQYARIWRGLGLSDGAFRIDAPAGVRVVEMEDDERVADGT